MRLLVTAIAVISAVGCDQTDNLLDQPQIASNMQAPEDQDACQHFIDGAVDEFDSLQETLAPDHPDVIRLQSLIRSRLIECYLLHQSVVLPDGAPPNSTPFSFNGHTYVFVPLSSTADQSSPSEQVSGIGQATARN